MASLRRVLHVTTTLYRRAADKAGQANPENTPLVNPITSAMYEIARDGLNGKARVTHATLAALVEVSNMRAKSGRRIADTTPSRH